MANYNDNDSVPQTSDLERARSTPLLPVVWMTGVLVWATVVALFLRVPTWAGIFLCTATGISFLVFLIGYLYLFTSDRDALRAERWRHGAGGRAREGADQPRALNTEQGMHIGPERPDVLVSGREGQELRGRVGKAGQRGEE